VVCSCRYEEAQGNFSIERLSFELIQGLNLAQVILGMIYDIAMFEVENPGKLINPPTTYHSVARLVRSPA
jgi:hypothetical protein